MSGALAIAIAGFLVLAALARARAGFERSGRARGLFTAAGRAELVFVTLLLGTLVILGGVQIFLRNAFDSGLMWADPVMRHIVLWLGATGAALASARMRHISLDVLTRVLPVSLRPLRRTIVYGATAVAAYLLAISALRLIANERSFGDIAFLGVRAWVVQLILPGAFLLVTYRTLLAIYLQREPSDLEIGA